MVNHLMMARERVQNELNELQDRIDKLVTFLDSDKSAQLNTDELALLNAQLDIMRAYAQILVSRLTVWRNETWASVN